MSNRCHVDMPDLHNTGAETNRPTGLFVSCVIPDSIACASLKLHPCITSAFSLATSLWYGNTRHLFWAGGIRTGHYCHYLIVSKPCPVLSFLLPFWLLVRFHWPHLEERGHIWGDDWSHSPFIRPSPSWGFPRFSSAVRQIPEDLCIAPGIIPLSPLSLATDVSLGASGL